MCSLPFMIVDICVSECVCVCVCVCVLFCFLLKDSNCCTEGDWWLQMFSKNLLCTATLIRSLRHWCVGWFFAWWIRFQMKRCWGCNHRSTNYWTTLLAKMTSVSLQYYPPLRDSKCVVTTAITNHFTCLKRIMSIGWVWKFQEDLETDKKSSSHLNWTTHHFYRGSEAA